MKIFSFDAEPEELYGKPFAIGAVVLDGKGDLINAFAEKHGALASTICFRIALKKMGRI